MIAWTEELRAETPTRHAGEALLPPADGAWSEYEASWLALKRRFKPAPSEALAEADRAVATREPAVAAHAGVIASLGDRALLDRALLALTAQFGAGFAFEVWLASWGDGRLTGSAARNTRHEERTLRHALLLAPEAERARASVLAHTVTGTDYELASLAHRMVFDQRLTRRIADVALSRDFGGLHEANVWAWMVSAAPDLETASRLVRAGLQNGAPLELTSLLDGFGLDAVPILTEVALGPHHAKDAVRALCLVGLPSVAELFRDLLRLGPLRPRAIEFFARFPELASVLEPLSREKTRHGKLALSVLEGLPKASPDGERADELSLPEGLEEELKSGKVAAVSARLDADERLRVAKVLRTRWQGVRDRKADEWLGRAALALGDRALVARFATGGGAAKLLPLFVEAPTSAALMAMLRLAARNDPLGQAARHSWSLVAKARGCSPDELEEAATAELERETIAEAGVELALAIGRGFAPVLVNAKGEELPPPRSWSERSRELARQLVADAQLLMERRPALYQRAMQSGRLWSASDFHAQLTTPFARAFVRSIVWVIVADGVRTPARVAEDGSLADVDDRKVSPTATATFAVAQPAELSAAWWTLFTDYELINPLGQLQSIKLP